MDAAGYDSTVAVRLGESADGERTIVVEDDGPGVPVPERAKVFEPGVTSKEAEGINSRGFGLALVQRVARRGGAASAVVLRAGRSLLHGSAQDKRGGTTKAMSAIRTLIIDDDVAVAGIHHGFLLARGGFDVVAMAHTGQQGLDLAAELRPELVLLDIHLPDMSGLDVLQRLRGRQQALDVLVITASRELDTVRGAMAGGVLHYLVKPFTSQALNERLDEYLILRRELAAGGAAGPLDQDSIDRLVAPSRRADGGGYPRRAVSGGAPGQAAQGTVPAHAGCRHRGAQVQPGGRLGGRAGPPARTVARQRTPLPRVSGHPRLRPAHAPLRCCRAAGEPVLVEALSMSSFQAALSMSGSGRQSMFIRDAHGACPV